MLLVGHIIAIIAVFIAGYASRPHLQKALKKLRNPKLIRTGQQANTKS